MSRVQVEVELFKGEEPIDFPEDVDEEWCDEALKGAKLSLDRGDSDRAVIYVAKDGELIEIIDETNSTFDLESIKARIDNIKEQDNE